ncbi:hypothetical protein VC83_03287 [Pseudogymnoascus destructans]|uniref:Uncharacterized protein n=1 Tax=Pseudogymnoascus destructans TaxID=655981 RepID=A0A177AE07_9PEZI|nr:uncharacterized protein VC83_03287 [Pseudogymnoascus destructans]OAF60346.1 hypothetical protein VC83_03287 [Pseudogymnoascus destructans]
MSHSLRMMLNEEDIEVNVPIPRTGPDSRIIELTSDEEKEEKEASTGETHMPNVTVKRGRGRPLGSKNKPKNPDAIPMDRPRCTQTRVVADVVDEQEDALPSTPSTPDEASYFVYCFAVSSPAEPTSFKQAERYKLQGGSALCLLILLSIPFLRKSSYEILLRAHQALASLVVYSVVRHLISQSNFDWSYVYIFAGVFAALLTFQ